MSWFHTKKFNVLVLVLPLALLFVILFSFWCVSQIELINERKFVKQMLEERNIGLDGLPTFTPNKPTIPWYRELLGDSTTSGIYLDKKAFTAEEVRRIRAVYPEVEFAIVE